MQILQGVFSVDYKKHIHNTLYAAKGLAEAMLFLVPVMVMRITTFALSFFGHHGKNIAERSNKTLRKLDAIHIIHNLNNLNPFIEPSALCAVKNISRKSVIYREDDIKKSDEFMDIFTDQEHCVVRGINKLEKFDLDHLKKYRAKGAITNGICFGATLVFIKLFLEKDISTEKMLVDFAKQFQEGFPKEATALQNIHLAYTACARGRSLNDRVKINRDLIRVKKNFLRLFSFKEGDVKKKHLNNEISCVGLLQNDAGELHKSLPAMEEKIHKQAMPLERYNQKRNRLNRIAVLIDLKIKKTISSLNDVCFTGIIHNKDIQKKFNSLDHGCYQLLFRTGETGGHALVYLKMEFGSYILDPNFGLFLCPPGDPAVQLCKLFNARYPGKKMKNHSREHFLEVYRYSEVDFLHGA